MPTFSIIGGISGDLIAILKLLLGLLSRKKANWNFLCPIVHAYEYIIAQENCSMVVVRLNKLISWANTSCLAGFTLIQ